MTCQCETNFLSLVDAPGSATILWNITPFFDRSYTCICSHSQLLILLKRDLESLCSCGQNIDTASTLSDVEPINNDCRYGKTCVKAPISGIALT
ncbi:hypothetical protein GJ496_001744 [Pomphorhynchus laevis]|nr:hypothetical protein GJ496_001744 [Pomphorhynchus laevis]